MPPSANSGATASIAAVNSVGLRSVTSSTSEPPVSVWSISAGFQLKPPPAARTVASKSGFRPTSAGTSCTLTSSAVSVMGAVKAGPSSCSSFSFAFSGDRPPMATPLALALTGTWLPARKYPAT